MSEPGAHPHVAVTPVAAPALSIPDRWSRTLLWTAALGALVFLMGLFVAPERTWGGYLMGYTWFVQLALAGPLFLAIVHLTGARWGYPLRRIPEAMGATLPIALGLGLLLLAGIHSLYEWSHAQVVAEDPLLQHKSAWLFTTGFAVRLVAYFAIWLWLGGKVLRRSLSREADPERRRGDVGTSALYMAVFAVTFSLASVDWLLSLDAHWFSTMYALYVLSGLACAGAAACTIALVWLRRSGALRAVVTRDVLDDLGKVLLGLSLLWAYLWYCQYMIVWYSDLPEETGYYILRRSGDWGPLVPASLVIHFAVPFLALMLRAWRRNGVALVRISVVILIGHALDLFVMIAPPLQPDGPAVGLWELGPVVGALALFAWAMLRGLARAPLSAPGAPATTR